MFNFAGFQRAFRGFHGTTSIGLKLIHVFLIISFLFPDFTSFRAFSKSPSDQPDSSIIQTSVADEIITRGAETYSSYIAPKINRATPRMEIRPDRLLTHQPAVLMQGEPCLNTPGHLSYNRKWSLVGCAGEDYDPIAHTPRIVLTQNVVYSLDGAASAAWSTTALDLTKDFIKEFQVYFGINGVNQDVNPPDDLGADGIVFVLQADPDELNAIGGAGRNIGYDDEATCCDAPETLGLIHSVGIEFDTFGNTGSGSEPCLAGGWDPITVCDPERIKDHFAFNRSGTTDHRAQYGAGGIPSYFQANIVNSDLEDGMEHRLTIVDNVFWTGKRVTLRWGHFLRWWAL